MKTRALIAAFALSAIVLGSGVSAFAYNGYHNYGNHAGMYAVSPENQGAYDAMMKDYYSRVSPIQDKLNANEGLLDAGQGIYGMIDVEQRTVVRIQVGAYLGVDARRAFAFPADGLIPSLHAVHRCV